MRILLVSQMYPGPADPDLGVFVAQMERALRENDCDLKDMKFAFLEADGGISILKESKGDTAGGSGRG